MIKAGNLNDSYYDAENSDIRDSDEFKEFKVNVLAFIRAEKSVTWRQLAEKFYYQHYWLTMAIDALDGKGIILEKHKTPERIEAK